MGAASGGRLALWLLTLAVLMASGATGIVVIGTGSAPPHGSPAAGQVTGSSGQRLAGDRKGTAAAQLGPGASGAGGGSANAKGRYNVGATHSPELLRALAGPLDGTGLPGSSSRSRARGVDVAADQHPRGANIDWGQVAAAGYSFAAVKATEGDYYANPWYADDAARAQAAGLQVTGYHVAIPNVSGGAAQANFAVGHLGPARALEVDVEYDPYTAIDHTNQCYGLTARQLVSWIDSFTREARQLTGQAPVIYTTAAWWRACTGDSSAFSGNPLWVAGYGTGQPAPDAWASWSYWQFTSAATVPGISGRDVDVSYAGSPRTTPYAPAEAAGVRGSGGSGGSDGAAGPSAAAGAAEAGGLAGLTGGSVASGQPVAEVTRPATSVTSASAAPSSPVPALVAPAPAATAPAPVVASPSPGPSD